MPALRRRTAALLLPLLTTAVAVPLLGAPAAAEPSQARGWRVVDSTERVVRKAGKKAVTAPLRAARVATSSDPVTAPFVVSYLPTSSSWTDVQKAAFQRGLDQWARLLVSAVPIKVHATMEAMPAGYLGSAGPSDVVQDPSDGAWYPIALGNAINGADLNGSAPEIEASFPSNSTLIHYGTGTPPVGTYDFTSTVMHEIGHGLGFLGSMTAQGSLGSYGIDDVDNPLVYDRFTVHLPTTSPTRLLGYPNGSTALGSALQGGRVFWDGAAGKAAAGGARPKLHAPSPFEQGSSYSHLDEDAYPPGTIDSLMTPVGDQQEVNPEPGPIALGMLADQGWGLSAAAEPPAASRYTPVSPVRLLDTRSGVAPAAVGPGGFRDLQVAGGGTGVPADAAAVVLNVTGVAPTAATNVRVYPATANTALVPQVSNLNLAAGRTRANLVTVKVGPDGRVRLRNNSGSLHLLADLAGYYAPTGATTYFPVSPSRALDTRPGDRLPAGATSDLRVAGAGSVPASATAVVLGVTAVNATSTTYVSAYPTPETGSAVPKVSNINVYVGGATPNLAIVKVGAGGQVRLRNNSGEVDLLADVYGYYEESAAGALFRALTPARVLDTRPGKVSAGQYRDLPMANAGGVPTAATAVVLNVTGTGPTSTTNVRVYPAPATGTAVPTVSTLNLVAGQTAADAAMVPVGSGSNVRLYNNSGDVALIVDVAGWFGPA